MFKLKLLIIVTLIIVLAAFGAGWKWHPVPGPHHGASGTEQTALGWTWDAPPSATNQDAENDQGEDEQ